MDSFNLTEYYFELFQNLVYSESGIRFSLINEVILKTRIISSMKSRNIENVGEYYKLLTSNKKELLIFLDNITTNLTKFFRTNSNFDLLKDYVLPALLKKKKNGDELKIWSAGCSTGEEPYSIAITCLEVPEISKLDLQIYATDLSYTSLEYAQDGIYDLSKVESVPLGYLSKYFKKVSPSEYKINDNIKNLVSFQYHNLMNRINFFNIDIIFCRNVLIYFDSDSVKLTVNRFYDILNDDGFLFIGHSESLCGLDTNFKFNNIDNSIVYTKS